MKVYGLYMHMYMYVYRCAEDCNHADFLWYICVCDLPAVIVCVTVPCTQTTQPTTGAASQAGFHRHREVPPRFQNHKQGKQQKYHKTSSTGIAHTLGLWCTYVHVSLVCRLCGME